MLLSKFASFLGQNWFLLILPLMLVIYSIILFRIKIITDILIKKIRGLYYSICMFILVFIPSLSHVSFTNNYLDDQIAGDIFMIILFFIIVLIVDYCIIDPRRIKLLGKGGLEFSEDKLQDQVLIDTFKRQDDITLSKIASLYYILKDQVTVINQQETEIQNMILGYDEWDYEEVLKSQVEEFCNLQQQEISFKLIKRDCLERVCNTYKLSDDEIKELKKRINGKKPCLNKSFKRLIIPYNSIFNEEYILIFETQNDIFSSLDSYIIVTVLSEFEVKLWNLVIAILNRKGSSN
ncbi:hypothetical protein [Vallitalea okinawensis]|uniref:hypothetical protein n=1 Tax=Vallitalea okinawensis TaxID=2078660 RepID=UPI000CFB36AB|nr:hypothetical protein [Vallitalea okinawensis]